MNQLSKKELGFFFIITGLVILAKIDLVQGSQRSKNNRDLMKKTELGIYPWFLIQFSFEALLNDPRFTNCMTNTGGPEDPNFVSILTKCYSIAGRPRFGKRSWNNQIFKHIRSREMDNPMNQQSPSSSQPMSVMEEIPAQFMYPLPYSRNTNDFTNY
ncbi:uncharacterized protein [Lepeophtheirus salmonis]|uniref:uncharacterized protein isoform X1 n=1 Tax=Lepeophtheirus salmonis TaxID=72036 RepID=UPI001AE27CD5|nr:uncharacterized protein LOC121115019 [Lepeophtheirus salmonis]